MQIAKPPSTKAHVPQTPSNPAGDLPAISILSTPLRVTDYASLAAFLLALAANPRRQATVVDFTNTHIVTLRRHDAEFFKTTDDVDYFIPDGMPLIWLMNAKGAKLTDRIYGPTFMNHALAVSPAHTRHYFLGGSQDCLNRLITAALKLNPHLTIAGSHHGYFPPADNEQVRTAINATKPDFLWVGLGTPRQQEWIHENHAILQSRIVLAVGFAFDVIAGTKKDAPAVLQRLGLTWLFRLLSEPTRLGPRYVKFNALFLWYLLQDQVARIVRTQPHDQ